MLMMDMLNMLEMKAHTMTLRHPVELEILDFEQEFPVKLGTDDSYSKQFCQSVKDNKNNLLKYPYQVQIS